jgi:hypothetical protein
LTDTGEDARPEWLRQLMEPFPAAEIGLRPQIWCTDCSSIKGGPKACKKTDRFGLEHVIVKCRECGQRITAAHDHLSFVGHANLTERLLKVDPLWSWRPMARDVDPDVLKAAIATGDVSIIRMVIDSSPPHLTEMKNASGGIEHGMWMEVIIHDENGEEIVMPGFGDAIGKPWNGNAVKEIIGDGLRNATYRKGAALALWKRQERERAAKENRAEGGTSAGALFDQGTAAAARTRAKAKAGEQDKAAEVPAGIDPEVQAWADLTWKLREQKANVGQIKTAVYDKAFAKNKIPLHCAAPWDRATKVTLHDVLARARKELEAEGRG